VKARARARVRARVKEKEKEAGALVEHYRAVAREQAPRPAIS